MDTMILEFVGEAGDTYRQCLAQMSEYGVEITTEDGEIFDAILLGPDYDGEFYNTVSVIRVVDDQWFVDDYEKGTKVESVVAKKILVN